jgi:hypothetical protein
MKKNPSHCNYVERVYTVNGRKKPEESEALAEAKFHPIPPLAANQFC